MPDDVDPFRRIRCHRGELARRAQGSAKVDYLGVGPVYGTQSKANPAPVLGVEQLRNIVAECPVPVIAIGSITAERVPEVLDTGAYGVAVISAITCASDPEVAAREFAEVIARWLAGHEEVPA